jgi:hypothetical protein
MSATAVRLSGIRLRTSPESRREVTGSRRRRWGQCLPCDRVLLTTAQTIRVKRRGTTTVDTIRPYAIEIAVTKVSKPAVIPVIF